MLTTQARADEPVLAERSVLVAEDFVELLCADEDLLRDEFDAIIRANWPSPPPAAPDLGSSAGRGQRGALHRREVHAARLPRRPRHPGIGGWMRQRSPPATEAAPWPGKAGDRHA